MTKVQLTTIGRTPGQIEHDHGVNPIRQEGRLNARPLHGTWADGMVNMHESVSVRSLECKPQVAAGLSGTAHSRCPPTLGAFNRCECVKDLLTWRGYGHGPCIIPGFLWGVVCAVGVPALVAGVFKERLHFVQASLPAMFMPRGNILSLKSAMSQSQSRPLFHISELDGNGRFRMRIVGPSPSERNAVVRDDFFIHSGDSAVHALAVFRLTTQGDAVLSANAHVRRGFGDGHWAWGEPPGEQFGFRPGIEALPAGALMTLVRHRHRFSLISFSSFF